jgi:hypothetical protein
MALPAPFCFAHFRKVNELGHPGKHNATKPNNAWWRRIRSGQHNPPVIIKEQICTAVVCSKLLTFKLDHCYLQGPLDNPNVTVPQGTPPEQLFPRLADDNNKSGIEQVLSDD